MYLGHIKNQSCLVLDGEKEKLSFHRPNFSRKNCDTGRIVIQVSIKQIQKNKDFEGGNDQKYRAKKEKLYSRIIGSKKRIVNISISC